MLFLREMAGVGSSFSTMTCRSNTPELRMELGMVEVNSLEGSSTWVGFTIVFFRLSLVACLISVSEELSLTCTGVRTSLSFAGDR